MKEATSVHACLKAAARACDTFACRCLTSWQTRQLTKTTRQDQDTGMQAQCAAATYTEGMKSASACTHCPAGFGLEWYKIKLPVCSYVFGFVSL